MIPQSNSFDDYTIPIYRTPKPFDDYVDTSGKIRNEAKHRETCLKNRRKRKKRK
jgi:hypothetical protein